MTFIIIPIEDAVEIFTKDELEAARKSINGKKVIVHEEILLQKKVESGLMVLPENNELIEWEYPTYEYESDELNTLLNSDEWVDNENENLL